jgi:23S rRNA (cytidine1920-2'-O)/16S rRNA (cytidine1409-2'-O)-methyltransferase
LPSAAQALSPNRSIIALIKPQFEVGRERLGKGGVIRDEKLRQFAIDQVLQAAQTLGMASDGVIASPIAGGDGNIEYLAHFRRTSES